MYEAVAEGLRVHGLHDGEEAKVADALSRAGLRPPERFYLRYPHELSGGQRQRVVIAGALVLDPDLIVADEPVSSLDASVRGEILALLLRLRDELGLTLVVVTHDLGLAWNIADRVAVMYLGRILEIGPTEEILSAPQHPYTKALLSVVPETRSASSRLCSSARRRSRPASRPAADSTPAALRWRTARLPTQVSTGNCRAVELPVLAAAGAHRRAFQRLPSRRGRRGVLRGVGYVAAGGSRQRLIDITTSTRHPSRRESEMLRREWTCIGRLDDLGLAASGRVIHRRRVCADLSQ